MTSTITQSTMIFILNNNTPTRFWRFCSNFISLIWINIPSFWNNYLTIFTIYTYFIQPLTNTLHSCIIIWNSFWTTRIMRTLLLASEPIFLWISNDLRRGNNTSLSLLIHRFWQNIFQILFIYPIFLKLPHITVCILVILSIIIWNTFLGNETIIPLWRNFFSTRFYNSSFSN